MDYPTMAKPAGHVLRPGRAAGQPALPLVASRTARWQSRSYARGGGGRSAALARGLQALGVAPGDRVALVAENRPEWTIADLAIMAAAPSRVPAFTTNTAADHRHVLSHSGAKGVIVSTKAMAERVLPAALEAPDLAFVVTIDELPIAQRIAKRLITWRDLLEARRRPAGRASTRPSARLHAQRYLPASSTPRAPAARPRA